MPGFEVFGEEERKAINEIFDLNGGILFAHGFDGMRKGVYRVREFEKAFAERMGVPYAQAVSSGSAAVKVGLKALGVGPGDEVVTTCHTFVATIEAILECGARPVLVDVNDTLNVDPKAVRGAVTDKTKAVVVVHMMGAPAEMDEIMAIAGERGILVLEDNAQCCGGTYNGKVLGTIGHMGTFSFDGGKTMTTWEGGMVVTSDEPLYLRARAYHDHGHEYSLAVGRGLEGALMPGFNYRMMELQGAMGLVQLGKLDTILTKQRANKARLKNGLEGFPFPFRRLADARGEIGDALIFYCDTKDRAGAFVTEMAAKGLGTKNLPDAIRWHFARNWRHMFETYGFYADTFETEWARSADLLARAIALPVMVNTPPGRLDEISADIMAIAGKVS